MGYSTCTIRVFVCTFACVYVRCLGTIASTFDLSLPDKMSGLKDTVVAQCPRLRNFPGTHKVCLCKRTIILNDSAY